jgi:hypothetical protein
MVLWVQHVWQPFVEARRAFLAANDPENADRWLQQPALLILDNFSGHQGQEFRDAIEASNTELLFVPKNMTGELQPCDVNFNRHFKREVMKNWQAAAAERYQQKKATPTISVVPERAADKRKFLANAIIPTFKYALAFFNLLHIMPYAHLVVFRAFESRRKLILTAFAKAGIFEAIYGKPFNRDDFDDGGDDDVVVDPQDWETMEAQFVSRFLSFSRTASSF